MTNQDYTHLMIVADRSGSMQHIQQDMNGGLKTLLEDQNELDGTLLVDITIFDTDIEQTYDDAAVEDITFPVIVPRGGTALYDAIGQSVVALGEKLENLSENDRPGKVLVVIITDGEENSSREYIGNNGARQIKAMIDKQRNDYQWEFLFLGANIDSFAVASGLGIPRGSTINYAASPDGATAVSVAASAYVTRTRSGLSADFTEDEREAASGL